MFIIHSLTHSLSTIAKPFIFIPGALWSHVIRQYQHYLRNLSSVDPSHYYVNEFETLNSSNSQDDDDDGMMDDDAWINPPDDELYEEEEEDENLVVLTFDKDVVVVEEDAVVDVQ